MSEFPIAEVMQAYADDAVVFAKEKFGIVLDLSEQSLVNIDTMLSVIAMRGLLKEEDLSEEQEDYLWTLCKVFGGYVGAVIIKHLGGQWETETGSDGSTHIQLKVANRFTASPPQKVWKRLTESEFDQIIGYYRGLQHLLGLTPFVPEKPNRA